MYSARSEHIYIYKNQDQETMSNKFNTSDFNYS